MQQVVINRRGPLLNIDAVWEAKARRLEEELQKVRARLTTAESELIDAQRLLSSATEMAEVATAKANNLLNNQISTCYHSGDIGDIVYSLLFINQCLGRTHLLLGPDRRWNTRLTFSYKAFEFIRPLLESQPYIHSVGFTERTPRTVQYDLNQFRLLWFDVARRRHLQINRLFAAYPAVFGFNALPENVPWLELIRKRESKPVLMHRSARYHNPNFPWQQVAEKYGGQLGFVGLREEYDRWVSEFGNVAEYISVNDGLEMASLIAGAKLFIGNQSFPMAVALGLNVPVVQEAFPFTPDCVFKRSNSIFFLHEPIQLPDV